MKLFTQSINRLARVFPAVFRRIIACFLLLACAALPLSAFAVDTDGDGVEDSVDAFPNHPEATTDTDGDGMPDKIDFSRLPLIFLDRFQGSTFESGWEAEVRTTTNPWGTFTSGWSVSGGYVVLSSYLSYTKLTLKRVFNVPAGGGARLTYDREDLMGGNGDLLINGQVVVPGRPGSGKTRVVNLGVGSQTVEWRGWCGYSAGCSGPMLRLDNVELRSLTSPILFEDADDDNDGVNDGNDKFPLDAAASLDSDKDGYPDKWNDACDSTCQDGSGLVLDNCPLTGNPGQEDIDRDRIGDVCDLDNDNDTLPDAWELANGHDPLKADYMVSAGAYHSCALDNTGVKCWGSNLSGQSTVPALVSPTAVSAGYQHTCAIDSNGVQCWGAGVANTGVGHNFGQSSPPALTNPTSVSAGYWHSCAIDSTGVVCWGKNDFGETSVPPLSNPVMVGAGKNFTCALDDNGVTCWGNNNEDQLVVVPPLVNPLSISVSHSRSCAVDQNGVKCWGRNTGGQNSVPSTLVNPQLAAAGRRHTCVMDNGNVSCWGDSTERRTIVPTLVNPTALSAGYGHTCALDDNGVKCWGRSAWGQLKVPGLDITRP